MVDEDERTPVAFDGVALEQVVIREAMTRLERLPAVAGGGVSSGLPFASGGTTTSPRRL